MALKPHCQGGPANDGGFPTPKPAGLWSVDEKEKKPDFERSQHTHTHTKRALLFLFFLSAVYLVFTIGHQSMFNVRAFPHSDTKRKSLKIH